MSRRRRAKKRIITKDPIYNSVLVSMIINKILWDGKKNIARKILYKVMDNIKKLTRKDPLEILNKAVLNITPKVTVKSRRFRGAIYQVPNVLNKREGRSLALRILIESTRSRTGRSTVQKLQSEIRDAYRNTGLSVRKKQELVKKARANKAFSRFRF